MGASAGKPREIIIESGTAPNPARASAMTDLERRAADNALLAGAVELAPPMRVTTTVRKVEREIVVTGGHCYDVSVAWWGTYRAKLTYTLIRDADARPLNGYVSSETGLSYPGEGVAHFCVERSGTAKLEILVDENAGPANAAREYAIVVGHRPETPAQLEARRRRSAAQKQTAEATRQATPAASERAGER